MPQPSGQVLLDSAKPNYASTTFWYANGTSLWNAKTGALESKTGTGAVVAEGGANVLTGNGSTIVTLASTLTLAGDFSIGFRARVTANNNDTMIAGDGSGTANFVWLNGSMTLRVDGNTVNATNASATTMASYWIVRSGSTVTLYKNGTLVGNFNQAVTQTFTIKNILAGYSGAFNFNGTVEFFHVISGVALDATAVSSYNTDPYQDLAAAATSATASGVTVSTTTSLVAGAATGQVTGTAGGATLTATASLSAGAATGGAGNSITLTSPAPYQTRQRNLSTGQATFTASGTYTGSPTSIQYRFNGGAWATLVASPSGGAFSASVTLPTGQGAFEVRFSNATGVTASAAYVTVGDVFVVAGQSNHAGRAPNKVDPVFTTYQVPKLGRDGLWKPLTEATTQSGSFDEAASAAGSYIGALSNRLQSVGVPVAFIPVAQGSTNITDWERYNADPTNPYFLYGDARQADIAAGGNRGMLYLQGESDAASGVAQATYQSKLDGIATNWQADTGGKLFIIQIVRWSSAIYSQIDAIRAAQAAVATSNTAVAGIADGNVWQSANDVHYQTTTHINALADVVSAGMVTAFYTTSATAPGATIGATAGLLVGTATGAASATAPGATIGATAGLLAGTATGAAAGTAPGITLQAVAQLLAGIASGGNASTAPGATVTTTASLLPGTASGQRSAMASGALWSAVASVVAGGASNGSIVWPTAPAGPTHRATVPFNGVRAIVTAETIEA